VLELAKGQEGGRGQNGQVTASNASGDAGQERSNARHCTGSGSRGSQRPPALGWGRGAGISRREPASRPAQPAASWRVPQKGSLAPRPRGSPGTLLPAGARAGAAGRGDPASEKRGEQKGVSW